MRILHIYDVAGVPSLLVQGLRERGIDADLIVRKKHPFGFLNETVLNVSPPVFLFRVLKLCRNYDLVHTHGLSYRLFFNANIFGLKALRAKFVLHLHGTEIRESHNRLSTKTAMKIPSQVLVSTPDLLSYCPRAVWLPTPVDPVFKPLDNTRRYGKALYFRKWYELEKEAMVYKECERLGLRLTVPGEFIPYRRMPFFLNQFEVFFDRFNIPSLSKTALEAQACGCRVIGWKGPIRDSGKISKEHNLKNVVRKLIKIYEEVSRS